MRVCQVGGCTHPSSLPIARDSTNPVDLCPCVTYSQAILSREFLCRAVVEFSPCFFLSPSNDSDIVSFSSSSSSSFLFGVEEEEEEEEEDFFINLETLFFGLPSSLHFIRRIHKREVGDARKRSDGGGEGGKRPEEDESKVDTFDHKSFYFCQF